MLYLQKSFLPGWKARRNGNLVELGYRYYDVLMTIPLEQGKNQVDFKFDPNSLRLGFFLFFLMSGSLLLALFRRWLT